jgi:ABC-2 type transport system permease protein
LPAGFGLLGASFGAAIAAAALLSVLVPYALPENSNPFAVNSGGGSAKGMLSWWRCRHAHHRDAIAIPVFLVGGARRGVGLWRGIGY